MVRNKFLLIAVLVGPSFVGLFPGTARADESGCTKLEVLQGTCSASATIGNGGVNIDAGKHSGGNTNDPGRGGDSGSDQNNSDCATNSADFLDCITIVPPGAPGNPGVNISDLRSFHPSPGTDHMQPNGWMIVGLDTNFYSVVGVQTLSGPLLGQTATVRFTPVAWHWDYGDGKAATRPTKGNTWQAQGIPDFDATPTSHIYEEEKTYYIDLAITFSAEYRYAGGDWAPVVGTLTLPANRLKITGGEAKTVLVGRDCTANPSGPGC